MLASETNKTNEKLESLFDNYSEIYPNELGTINGIKARVNIDPNAQQGLIKARAVPFAMKEAVEAEID